MTLAEAYKEYAERFRDFVFAPYLDDDENIYAIFHRHPFIILFDSLKVLFVGFVIPIFLYLLFPEIAGVFVLWLAVGFIRVVYVFIDWYHDVIMVTDTCLIDIYWEGVFTRRSTRLEFSMVEAVTTEKKGALQTFFNYGRIIIQSAGGNGTLELKDAINPRNVEKRVLHFQAKFLENQQFRDADSLKVLLGNMLRTHVKTQTDIVTIKK